MIKIKKNLPRRVARTRALVAVDMAVEKVDTDKTYRMSWKRVVVSLLNSKHNLVDI